MREGSFGKPLALGLGLLVSASACAHVKQDDFDRELAQIRQEMQEGNEALEQRIGSDMRGLEDRIERRMNDLEAELGLLRDDFRVTVERLESAIRFNAPIHFAFDDAEVQDQYRPVLDRFAEVVAAYYQDVLITVEGFTDPAGSAEYNLRLGQERAESVMEYLGHAGIPTDRIRAVSYGAATERQVSPGAQGPGQEGWENRRVAMVIDFGSADRPRAVTDEEEREEEP